MSTINYWAMRCTPLFEGEVEVEVSDKSPAKETIFVAANRIGSEKCKLRAGTIRSCHCNYEQKALIPLGLLACCPFAQTASTFAGSSCILRFEQGEQPEMQGCLGTRTTGILQVEC